jgi:hypothetical protein
MSISTVEVYEKLKPSLGEEGTKALLAYMEETVGGNVATKEDLHTLREEMSVLREEMSVRFEKVEGEIAVIKATMATKEDIHQLRLLLVIIIAIVVLLNPTVWEVIGNLFGVVR